VSFGARFVKSVCTLMLATLAATGLWSAANAHGVVLTSDQLADAQRMILALSDSVHTLHAQVLHDAALNDSAPEMILPVNGTLTSRFQRSRLHPVLQLFRPHEGIDLSAPVGTPIVAVANGTVTFVGWRLGDGLTVELAHNGGVSTLYAHCRSTRVHVGERVRAGEAIAAVGSSGLATGPHVHFEVHLRGQAIDPLRYLAAARDSTTIVAEHLRGEH
jgi:murein DD-endopeptidase MepM/ murein hydrolase activator NlpD